MNSNRNVEWFNDSRNYYRPDRTRSQFESPEFIRKVTERVQENITATSTEGSLAGYGLDADNCNHCHAAYGHKITCPLLNRNVAEAQSDILNKPDADFLKALKVTW